MSAGLIDSAQASTDLRGDASARSDFIYAVDEDQKAVLAVDPSTGTRRLISGASSAGISLVTPDAIAVVNLIVSEPGRFILVVIAVVPVLPLRRSRCVDRFPERNDPTDKVILISVEYSVDKW